MAVAALIPAAGYGTRMKSSENKQFMLLRKKPVLIHTLEVFAATKEITEIIVITREDEIEHCKELLACYNIPKIKDVVAGGKERQHSVWNGLQAVSPHCKTVVVHDGARPLLLPELLSNALQQMANYNAVVVGVPVKDTIKVVDDSALVVSTPKRNTLWAVQTPQIFARDLLVQAYEKAWENNILATDDAALIEVTGGTVKMVMGSYENIKITTQEDIILAEAFLTRREQ